MKKKMSLLPVGLCAVIFLMGCGSKDSGGKPVAREIANPSTPAEAKASIKGTWKLKGLYCDDQEDLTSKATGTIKFEDTSGSIEISETINGKTTHTGPFTVDVAYPADYSIELSNGTANGFTNATFSYKISNNQLTLSQPEPTACPTSGIAMKFDRL